MKSNIGEALLDGEYLVYYDIEKTQLMARIGFFQGTPNGVLERYNKTGDKVYSTVIDNGNINGVLTLISSNKYISKMNFNHNVFSRIEVDLSDKYVYDITNNLDISLSIKTSDNVPKLNVLFDPAHNINILQRYTNGSLSSNITYSENKLNGISEEVFNTKSRMVYSFENGVINEPVNVNYGMFDRDLELAFIGKNVTVVKEQK